MVSIISSARLGRREINLDRIHSITLVFVTILVLGFLHPKNIQSNRARSSNFVEAITYPTINNISVRCVGYQCATQLVCSGYHCTQDSNRPECNNCVPSPFYEPYDQKCPPECMNTTTARSPPCPRGCWLHISPCMDVCGRHDQCPEKTCYNSTPGFCKFCDVMKDKYCDAYCVLKISQADLFWTYVIGGGFLALAIVALLVYLISMILIPRYFRKQQPVLKTRRSTSLSSKQDTSSVATRRSSSSPPLNSDLPDSQRSIGMGNGSAPPASSPLSHTSISGTPPLFSQREPSAMTNKEAKGTARSKSRSKSRSRGKKDAPSIL